MKKKKTSPLLPLGKAVFALSAFLIAALSSARADEPCKLATLTGPYVFTTLGQEAGGYAATFFVLTSDGNGNLSGSGTESLNGTIISNVTATGTYTADYSCEFTATTTDELGNVRDLAGTIIQKGGRIDGISTGPGTDFQFTAFLQHRDVCTVSSGAGYIVSDIRSALTPYGSSTAAEQWNISKKGTGTGNWVANYGGTIAQGTATATFNTNDDCTYTEAVTRSDGTTANYYGAKGLDGFDTVIWLAIETDNGWASISTITLLCSYWPRC
ncbi:MAG: hypothetical protein ABR908_03535 [Terriglobales bacterium]|jgi:hypothetical protein